MGILVVAQVDQVGRAAETSGEGRGEGREERGRWYRVGVPKIDEERGTNAGERGENKGRRGPNDTSTGNKWGQTQSRNRGGKEEKRNKE